MSDVTQFFRCVGCQRAFEISERCGEGKVKCRCGAGRFYPTVLTKWEVFKYLVLHPSVVVDTLRYKLKGDSSDASF